MQPIKNRKFMAGIVLATVAAFPLAACTADSGESGSDESSPTSAESEQAGPPEPVAEIDSLTGVDTAIALDQGFTDALESLELTPGVTGEAELTDDGSLVFPITGGNVTYFEPGTVSPYVIGQVQHEGSGLTLTAGDTEVELSNLNVDPGVSRVYGDVSVNGEVAVSSAYLFTLNGSTLNPLETEGDTAVLQGTEVSISPVAADLLNETFGTDAVTEELLVGTATITVNTTPGD